MTWRTNHASVEWRNAGGVGFHDFRHHMRLICGRNESRPKNQPTAQEEKKTEVRISGRQIPLSYHWRRYIWYMGTSIQALFRTLGRLLKRCLHYPRARDFFAQRISWAEQRCSAKFVKGILSQRKRANKDFHVIVISTLRYGVFPLDRFYKQYAAIDHQINPEACLPKG